MAKGVGIGALISFIYTISCAFGQIDVDFWSNMTDESFSASEVLPAVPLSGESLLASMFRNGSSYFDNSRCPKQSWLYLFKEADVKFGKHARMSKQRYRMLDIGFNKGYNFAIWSSIFAPVHNISALQWYEKLKIIPNLSKDSNLCGSCEECSTSPAFNTTLPDELRTPTLHFAGAEINKLNIDAVRWLFTEVKKVAVPPDKLTLDLFHGAAARATAEKLLKVSKCAVGDDHCRLDVDTQQSISETEVEVISVIDVGELVKKFGMMYHDFQGRRRLSSYNNPRPPPKLSPGRGETRKGPHSAHEEEELQNLLRHHSAIAGSDHPVRHTKAPPPVRSNDHAVGQAAAQHTIAQARATEARAALVRNSVVEIIDILRISTGGDEPPILQSAFGVFEARRVRAVSFEYSNSSAWQETTLGQMVQALGNFNLACYFQGQERLWALPSMVWNEQYEIQSESNVLCVLRSDVWFHAIQRIVVTESTVLD